MKTKNPVSPLLLIIIISMCCIPSTYSILTDKCIATSESNPDCCIECKNHWFAANCQCYYQDRIEFFVKIPAWQYIVFVIVLNTILTLLYLLRRLYRVNFIRENWKNLRVGKAVIFEDHFIQKMKDEDIERNTFYRKIAPEGSKQIKFDESISALDQTLQI